MPDFTKPGITDDASPLSQSFTLSINTHLRAFRALIIAVFTMPGDLSPAKHTAEQNRDSV